MLKMFTELEVLVKETTCRVSRRQVGAGIVEYLLLVVFIALVLIVSLLFFSGQPLRRILSCGQLHSQLIPTVHEGTPERDHPIEAPASAWGLRHSPPVSVLIGLITGVLLLASVRLQIRDVDLYWHLLAGHEILSARTIHGIGADWSFAPDPQPWVTTQWLAEVALHVVHALTGWPGLVAYRTITAAAAVVLLANSTLRGRPAILAGFPYVIAATAVVAVSQERSNQASLIGAAALGGVLVCALSTGRLPRWWLMFPATWIWANFHGGWVLVPMVLMLVALGRALDHGIRDQIALKALSLSLFSAVIGTLTPAGSASTLAILRFSGATDAIEEWRPTTPMDQLGLLTAAMAVLIIVSMSRTRTPRSTVLAAVLLLLFSWTAMRNVAPALLILAPLVADRLTLAFPTVGTTPEPRWAAPVGIVIAGIFTVGGLAMLPGRDLLPTDEYPVQLAQRVGMLPGTQRVLNDYNLAGLVLQFAGPGDMVGIDGRTDRYGPRYIEDYLGLEGLHGEWEALLGELKPTSALLEQESALAHVLVEERGWRSLGEENGYVLLISP